MVLDLFEEEVAPFLGGVQILHLSGQFVGIEQEAESGVLMGIFDAGHPKRMLVLAADDGGGLPAFLQTRCGGETPILMLNLIEEISRLQSRLQISFIPKGFKGPQKPGGCVREITFFEIDVDGGGSPITVFAIHSLSDVRV